MDTTYARLTREQQNIAIGCFKVWISLKCAHESFFRDFITGDGFKPEFLASKIAVDADHSALLRRLMDGKDPLPDPPPLQNSYPVYPD